MRKVTISSFVISPLITGTHDLSLLLQINFELVSGYVYSAPADMLDSQPGTLKLTTCIDMCRNNRSCMAVNYETGLCVLFSSNADMYPGEYHNMLRITTIRFCTTLTRSQTGRITPMSF